MNATEGSDDLSDAAAPTAADSPGRGWDRLARIAMAAVVAAVGTGLTAAATTSGPLDGARPGWVRTAPDRPGVAAREPLITALPIVAAADGPDTGGPVVTVSASAGGVEVEVGMSIADDAVTVAAKVADAPPPDPVVVPRPIPEERPTPPPDAPPPPWEEDTRTTPEGYTATDIGCAAGTSASALDDFFSQRMGPVIGMDYQHVYPLGGVRYLWLFQDTFVDHSGTAERLDQASFVHNAAMLQNGTCFTLFHRGSATDPDSFEPGTGERTLSTWFWPLGGETTGDGRIRVFWAEMVKTSDPTPPDGLGWVPARTWLATYDAATLGRVGFQPAPESGVDPIYGYAVASDDQHTYLFGNSYDQNLERQGGWWNGPHSATRMYVARVPRGRLDLVPEYRTADGWSADRSAAVVISQRWNAENPMQPRFLDGQWVASTKADGYWGDQVAIDVARDPWGPWTTVEQDFRPPHRADPAMNTYHAHLMPWLSGGALVVSMSQNGRDMLADAWPNPERYRLQFFASSLVEPPPVIPPSTTSTTSTTSTSEPRRTTTDPTTTEPPPSDPPTVPTTSEPPPTTTGPTTDPTTTDPTTTTTNPCAVETTVPSTDTTDPTTAPESSSPPTTDPCATVP